MRIITPGKPPPMFEMLKLKCFKCGCEFEVTTGELRTTEHWDPRDQQKYCNCPNCFSKVRAQ